MKYKKLISIIALVAIMFQSSIVFADENEETVPPETDRPEIEDLSDIPEYDALMNSGKVTPIHRDTEPAPRQETPEEKATAREQARIAREAQEKAEQKRYVNDMKTMMEKNASDIESYEDSKTLVDTSVVFLLSVMTDETIEDAVVEEALKAGSDVAVKAIASEEVSDEKKVELGRAFITSQKEILKAKSAENKRDIVEKSLKSFVKNAIAEASSIKVTADAELSISKDEIEDALEKADMMKKGLVEALDEESNESLDADTVEIDLLATNAENSRVVKLDAETSKAIVDAKKGIEINDGKVRFIIKAKTLEEVAGHGVTVKQEVLTTPLPQEEGMASTGATWDLSLNDANGNAATFTEKPSIRFALDAMDASIDKGLLGVYIFDEISKEYEYVPTRYDLASNELVIDAPHFSIYTLMTFDKSYKDVDNAWAKREIKVLSAMHVINGVGDDNFAPNGRLSRAAYTAMLVRAFDLKAEGSSNYSDVSTADWFANVALVAKELSLTKNTDQFAGNEMISREEMAYMTAKALGYSGSYTTDKYVDASSISEYARDAVGFLTERGDLNGSLSASGAYNFNPKDLLTRQEAVKVIYNVLNLK